MKTIYGADLINTIGRVHRYIICSESFTLLLNRLMLSDRCITIIINVFDIMSVKKMCVCNMEMMISRLK
jgi:hypothetical protein